ncbi:TetR/AcrR family transcriptional regulator [Fusibacter bizertensis]
MNKRVLKGIETKKRLIECAQILFRDKGYHNVTVDDIIKKANSSKGSFYTHFNSKEELIINMLPLVDEKYYAFLKDEQKSANSLDNIALFMRYVLMVIRDEVGLDFISAIYASQLKETSNHFLTATDRAYYEVLKKIIEHGKATGEIKVEFSTEYIVNIFTSCIRGVIYDWCLKRGEFDLETYGVELINMLLNQIKN